MKQVGVYEAKTTLPKLLEEVEHGETVTITRHGRPIARLMPMEEQKPNVQEALDALRAFRERHSLGGITHT